MKGEERLSEWLKMVSGEESEPAKESCEDYCELEADQEDLIRRNDAISVVTEVFDKYTELYSDNPLCKSAVANVCNDLYEEIMGIIF